MGRFSILVLGNLLYERLYLPQLLVLSLVDFVSFLVRVRCTNLRKPVIALAQNC